MNYNRHLPLAANALFLAFFLSAATPAADCSQVPLPTRACCEGNRQHASHGVGSVASLEELTALWVDGCNVEGDAAKLGPVAVVLRNRTLGEGAEISVVRASFEKAPPAEQYTSFYFVYVHRPHGRLAYACLADLPPASGDTARQIALSGLRPLTVKGAKARQLWVELADTTTVREGGEGTQARRRTTVLRASAFAADAGGLTPLACDVPVRVELQVDSNAAQVSVLSVEFPKAGSLVISARGGVQPTARQKPWLGTWQTDKGK
jgi:hypothetical protein